VLPKTPEAALLHFVDNIDARMEMFLAAYATAGTSHKGQHEWVRPLGVAPVTPLAPFLEEIQLSQEIPQEAPDLLL
jgi:3'-5' exoribonuclease